MDGDLSDVFSFLTITQLPGKGSLEFNGSPVIENAVLPVDLFFNLTFIPGENENGEPYTSFKFRVSDGSEFSDAYTMTINVSSVNDLPASDNATVTANQDETFIFSATDFPFSDDDGDAFAALRLTSLVSKGKMQFNGTDVVAGQEIPAGQLSLLTFTPEAGEFGSPYTAFQFGVSDGQEFSPQSYVMIINVSEANAGSEQLLTPKMKLSPNPSAGFVTVEAESSQPFESAEILVSDLAGRLLVRTNIPDTGTRFEKTMDLSELTPGVYFVKIRSEKQAGLMKLVVE
jgi:hypothetical protein